MGQDAQKELDPLSWGLRGPGGGSPGEGDEGGELHAEGESIQLEGVLQAKRKLFSSKSLQGLVRAK